MDRRIAVHAGSDCCLVRAESDEVSSFRTGNDIRRRVRCRFFLDRLSFTRLDRVALRHRMSAVLASSYSRVARPYLVEIVIRNERPQQTQGEPGKIVHAGDY